MSLEFDLGLRNKGTQIRKKVKFSQFADDMILNIENPKDTIRKLLANQ